MIVAVSTNNKKIDLVVSPLNETHRYRRTNHVLIFPTWSCMSCCKLLQSHLLRHLTFLNLSCTHLVTVCHVSCCWPKFQSIPTDDGKQCQYQYQTILLIGMQLMQKKVLAFLKR